MTKTYSVCFCGFDKPRWEVKFFDPSLPKIFLLRKLEKSPIFAYAPASLDNTAVHHITDRHTVSFLNCLQNRFQLWPLNWYNSTKIKFLWSYISLQFTYIELIRRFYKFFKTERLFICSYMVNVINNNHFSSKQL